MAEKTQYRTRQREDILSFLRTTAGGHFTAADVCEHFRAQGRAIGTATVYRQLERLTGEGQVKKYILSDNGGACFEYIDPEQCCRKPVCYHLKCETCGRLIHAACQEITGLEDHLLARHGFRIDPNRTVFYGVCQACREAEEARI